MSACAAVGPTAPHIAGVCRVLAAEARSRATSLRQSKGRLDLAGSQGGGALAESGRLGGRRDTLMRLSVYGPWRALISMDRNRAAAP
jgi:hypothetical protein